MASATAIIARDLTRRDPRWGERIVEWLLRGAGWFSIAVMAAIVVVLVTESIPFFSHVSPWAFFTGTRWAPVLEPQSFGVLPLVCGTFLVAAGAALIALPLGVGSAMFLAEYSPSWLRGVLKPLLEVLAGIPTVVYGYFAISFVTPKLQLLIPQAQVFNAASASIVVGIMILPTVASLCDDAFLAVPRSLRDAAHALGATRFEVSARIVFPAALSGVFASFVLAISRAIGETMAVTLAAGATPKMTLNPLESIQTMTAFIVQLSLGDTPAGTVEYQSLFAVGMLLFAITLVMNVIANRVLRRYRETYE
jgi:phosphate transport system permease protein